MNLLKGGFFMKKTKIISVLMSILMLNTGIVSNAATAEQKRGSNYNRGVAKNYALEWANGYNPKYVSFGSDCINFVSQCLQEGGYPDGKAPGWHKPQSTSDTGPWTSISLFIDAWTETTRVKWGTINDRTDGKKVRITNVPSYIKGSNSGPQLGEVVFYDFDGKLTYGGIDHSAIISNGDLFTVDGVENRVNALKVCAHTSPRRNREWTLSAYAPEGTSMTFMKFGYGILYS